MSSYANPLLYLNMGGEMLYVLRQRLKAQKIADDKSVQVLDEVSRALIDPLTVSNIFPHQSAEAASIPVSIDMPAIRESLERAALSSIMSLDESSIGKLFDLMIMMVKYQITAATGPRELLLITLNHIDAMRDALMDSSGQKSIVLVHRMLIRLYGNFTYDEMWKMREACLIHLENYNVRVSILLRLGLQKENGSFNLSVSREYNERYREQENNDLSKLVILENSCKGCNVGSLELIGERVTRLGCNIYSPFYRTDNNKPLNKLDDYYSKNTRDDTITLKGEPGSQGELEMLAIQLGRNGNAVDAASTSNSTRSNNTLGPFTLRLFNEIDEDSLVRSSSVGHIETRVERKRKNSPIPSIVGHDNDDDDDDSTEPRINYQHKAKLNDICANLFEDELEETGFLRKIELLELIDQLE